LSIVRFGPQMRIVRDVDELHVHPYLIGRALCAAFQNMRDAELSRDLEQIARRALESLRGSTRDHLQISNFGEARENLLLNALGKIGIGFVFAQIFERQHGDAFATDSRYWCRRRLRSDRSFAPRVPQPVTANGKHTDNQTRRCEKPDPTLVRSRESTGGFGRLLNCASFDFKSPSEHKRYGKTKRDRRDKDRQNPLGRVIGGHDGRAYWEDEPCNNCIAERDAINLPLFQLTEERAHLGPFAYRVSAI